MLDRAFTETFAAFAREIRRDTLNDRLYTHQGAVLLDAAQFYGSPTYRLQAIDAFHKGIELSPRRIQPRLLLASVYTGARDYERAIVVLTDAVKSDPQLGEPRYRLAQAYVGAGQSDSALASLKSSLRFGYVGVPETYLSMGKRLEFSGRSAEAASLYADYLETKYTKAVWDRPGTIDTPVRPPTLPWRRTCRSSTRARRTVSRRSKRPRLFRHSILRERRSSIDSSPTLVRAGARAGLPETPCCPVHRCMPRGGVILSRLGRAECSAESSKPSGQPL